MNDTLKTLADLQEGKYYKVKEVQSLLKNLGLLYSIYTIRDYETWKCMDYKCGKRHDNEVSKCEKCGGSVRSPRIESPRTFGNVTTGHRRYSADEVRKVVEVFSQRV